ncbi:MAG: tandem-95 repeat protein, partial [candidate division Zixibacteria bacterium]|nr:tandem-95 repeat protein [candidate division Zixibacteria bacterium]MBU1469350.1 tandem-95 repeat protein [candidate division Zixibacteria bacterium]
NNVNLAPIMTAIGSKVVDEGVNLNFGISASDADGTIPTLTAEDVPLNATFVDNANGTGTFDFNPDFTQSGPYSVRFIASDGALADTEVVAITVNNINLAPVLAGIGSQSVDEGANLNFGVSASDPDATTPTLMAEDVPTNAMFTDNGDGTGTFDFNPDFTQSGPYNVRFIASDGVLADTEIVAITVNHINLPPIIDPIGPRAVVEGANLNFTLTSSDPDGTTPQLSAETVPENATFTDNGDGTGTFDFNPVFTQSAIYLVTFIASDGVLADTEAVVITVYESGNQAPIFAATSPQSVDEGSNLNFSVSAVDPDGTIPILTAENVPANATFTVHGNGSGTLDFNPDFTQSGPYNVRFIASDGALADTEIVAITVNNINLAPVLAGIGSQSVDEGANLNVGVSASDPDATTPALTAEDVPTNATFTDNGDGTGVFDFTPGFDQSGPYTVLFIATDGILSDSEYVSITVTELGTGTPPASVTDLDAEVSGSSIRLSWSDVSTDTAGAFTTVSRYVIYRGTKAYFDPTPADSIAGILPGVAEFFDNDTGGADVVGDTTTDYFYLIKSVDIGGLSSGNSNRVGCMDMQIIATSTTNYNLCALPFVATGITNAQQLVASMGGTSNVLTVNKYITSSQSYQAWFAAGFGTNFSVSAGSVFQVNAAQNFVWSIAGQVPDPGSLSYQIVTTPTTSFSLVMIPFEYEDIFIVAQDVIDNVPGLLNTLNEFVPTSQSFRSRFAAGFGINFGLRAGRVYQANGAAPGVFPAP